MYCVHTLRHTCATLLYRNGIDIRTIKELLRHVQIDTTEIYTHLYDYEQILASQAEQENTKADNLDNLNSLRKLLNEDFGNTKANNILKAILNFL